MALNDATPTRIIDSRHPSFHSHLGDWETWRLTFEGGEIYRDKYLRRFDSREDKGDFELRRDLTPVPAFAKSAICDIRNSIFQRMRDITRVGGTQEYKRAVAGEGGGVDRRGSSMNAFLGMKVLTELLVMGRCGIYVDNSVINGVTMADVKGASPYLYPYQIEDILSWTCADPDQPSQFQAVLLRDTCVDYDRRTYLSQQTFKRFRLMWIDQDSGKVMLQFYNEKGDEIDRENMPSTSPYMLELDRIPFVMPDIGDSLMKDVAGHQKACLNLTSRDVWYALQANFSFYIEQRDMRAIGAHLKQAANEDGTATSGGQGASDEDIKVGTMRGRAYDKGANAPGYIHPSSEPLKASIALQEKYEGDIRKLVNLSVQSLAQGRSSAESKSLDNAGLESGLSFIGLVLESAERDINKHWAAYENRVVSQREVATVKYPDRYSLKTDGDRIEEAAKLSKLIYTVPGQKAKREIAKDIVTTLLGGRVDVGTIDDIHNEIDKSNYLTSDPNTIIQAVEAGLCGDETGSQALGFAEGEAAKAQEDHLKRAIRIMEAQAMNAPGPTVTRGSKEAARSIQDPAARGLKDLAANPAAGAVPERAAATDTTTNPSTKPPVRGNSKGARVTGKPQKGV